MSEVHDIKLNKIALSKNSRLTTSDADLSDLMASIKSSGLLQPIGVVKAGDGYRVIYGNRRFLACSRLGLTEISCIVHDDESDVESDIKNLAENIQRRSISLHESGRYMQHLSNKGLKQSEIGARLGISASYVSSCLKAYNEVPDKFKSALHVNPGSSKNLKGKITMKTARSIISAAKSYRLTKKQTEPLFEAAKNSDDFNFEKIRKYAADVSQGKTNFLKKGESFKVITTQTKISEREYERLYKKHIDNGPFRSLSAVFNLVLSGEKVEKVKVENKFTPRE